MHRSWQTWQRARQALLVVMQWASNRLCGAPSFPPGQRVWLVARDLPLWVKYRKLAPRYIGPYKILCCINPVAYRLDLPWSLKINPTVHVSWLKPVLCSPLAQPAPAALPPPHIIDDQLLLFSTSWTPTGCMGIPSTWLTGRGMGQSTTLGS